VRAVLFHGADRQNRYSITGDGFADFGPGEFFVSILQLVASVEGAACVFGLRPEEKPFYRRDVKRGHIVSAERAVGWPGTGDGMGFENVSRRR
jgi:hypothetical protein